MHRDDCTLKLINSDILQCWYAHFSKVEAPVKCRRTEFLFTCFVDTSSTGYVKNTVSITLKVVVAERHQDFLTCKCLFNHLQCSSRPPRKCLAESQTLKEPYQQSIRFASEKQGSQKQQPGTNLNSFLKRCQTRKDKKNCHWAERALFRQISFSRDSGRDSGRIPKLSLKPKSLTSYTNC